MLYNLQVLRNSEPVLGYTAAIDALTQFEYHLIGQPVTVCYYTTAEKDVVSGVVAVGIKDYTDSTYVAGDTANYVILSSGINDNVWRNLSEDGQYIINSEDVFRFLSTDSATWTLANVSESFPGDNCVSYVSNSDGVFYNRIYKGNEICGTTNANDLVLTDTTDFYTAGDSLSTALSNVWNKEQHLTWNTGEDVTFSNASWQEFLLNLPTNPYAFTHITNYGATLFLGTSLIGDFWNPDLTTRSLKGKTMPYNIGDFHYGDNLDNVHNVAGFSEMVLIGHILFPDDPKMNYGDITKPKIESLFSSEFPFDPLTRTPAVVSLSDAAVTKQTTGALSGISTVTYDDGTTSDFTITVDASSLTEDIFLKSVVVYNSASELPAGSTYTGDFPVIEFIFNTETQEPVWVSLSSIASNLTGQSPYITVANNIINANTGSISYSSTTGLWSYTGDDKLLALSTLCSSLNENLSLTVTDGTVTLDSTTTANSLVWAGHQYNLTLQTTDDLTNLFN